MELCHVLTQTAWAVARKNGQHAPPELDRDGFLHCCTAVQLDFVLGRHFNGARDLVVLVFETGAVSGTLRWVGSEPDQPPFPHLYGPIPCAAVRRTTTL